MVYKFNFSTDRFETISTVKAASEKLDNWVTHAEANYPANPFDAAGKIHTSLIEYKGKMYFGTHATCDMPSFQEDLETYPKFFRGGHLYSIDINSNVMTDCNGFRKSVMAPGNGIMDVHPDYHHNGFYGIGYPTGRFFYHNLSNGESREIWLCPQGLKNRDAGTITRNLIVDNHGRAYFSVGLGLIGYNVHTNDTVFIPFPAGHTNTSGHFFATAHSVTRDSIYFIGSGANELFRLRVKAKSIDYLAPTSAAFLALRWDQNKLYYLRDAGGSDNRLYCYDIRTENITSEVVGGNGFSGSGYWYGTGNPIDKNGDIWANASHNTNRVLKISMNAPCAICQTEVWDWGDPPVTARKSEPVKDKTVLAVSPNPFSTSVKIECSMPNSEFGMRNVKIGIYDVTGKQVYSAFRNPHSALTWNTSNQPGGIYIFQVKAGGRVYTQRATLIK
jgi:hypothetical protein